MEIRSVELSEWGELLPETGVEVFHLPEALSVIEDHADGELRLLAGFRGEQPVALMPVVEQDRTFGTAVLSPPPGFSVPRLGPVLMPTSPKRSKRERLHRRFAENAIDHLDLDDRFNLFRTACSPSFEDPRPFEWEEFVVDTAFTYHIDLDRDLDDIMNSFSSSLRREIRNARDAGVTTELGDRDDARDIYELTRRRYEETGDRFPLSWEYVADLLDALDDRARPYVLRDPDGEFLGGITALFGPDTVYFWQGGGRTTYDGQSVNSLLHWRIIEDAVTEPDLEGITRYDLVGANTRRLSKYKAKYGGDLVPYYVVETDSVAMDLAKNAYQLLER